MDIDQTQSNQDDHPEAATTSPPPPSPSANPEAATTSAAPHSPSANPDEPSPPTAESVLPDMNVDEQAAIPPDDDYDMSGLQPTQPNTQEELALTLPATSPTITVNRECFPPFLLSKTSDHFRMMRGSIPSHYITIYNRVSYVYDPRSIQHFPNRFRLPFSQPRIICV